MTTPHQSSKRRHSGLSSVGVNDSEALLWEAMKPLSDSERANWPGWIELESEPSFFTVMMKELGIKGVKAEELLGLDDDCISNLPKPIYGLVFLFEHKGGQAATAHPESEDCDLWFANQATNNACATVALLNIVMNQEQIDIGLHLRSLRNDTKPCIPPHRGHHIANNTHIRTIHNKFARRMDQLLADACLQDQAKKNSTPYKRRKTPRLGMRRKSSSLKSQDAPAFHFVAYVPVGEIVYELDGLRPGPVMVGRHERLESWTAVAAPHIQARMLQYESDQTSFSLIALCDDSAARNFESELQRAVCRLSEVDREYRANCAENAGDAVSEFLQRPEVVHIAVEQSMTMGCYEPDLSSQRLQLLDAAESALQRCKEHQAVAWNDESCVQQRQRDYGLAIHTWLSFLSSNMALESLADTV